MLNGIKKQSILNKGVVMKTTVLGGFLLALSVMSSPSYSQVNVELNDACHSDVDVIDGIVELIQGGNAADGVFTAEEVAQIRSVLGDAQDLSVRDSLATVLEACSEGRIFQFRNKAIIDAG